MKLRLLSLLAVCILGNAFAQEQEEIQQSWSKEYSKSKSFIENKGQFDQNATPMTGEIKYAIDFGSTRIFFGEKGVSYSFLEAVKIPKAEREALRTLQATTPQEYKAKEKLVGKFNFKSDEVGMTWYGSNSSVKLIGVNKTVDYHNYTTKNDKGEYEYYTEVKGYEKLLYKNLYPNIDVEYIVHPEIGVKYALTVHPGANPNDVKMIFDKDISLINGELHIPTSFGDILDHAPITFYNGNHDDVIDSKFNQDGRAISFELSQYDATKTIVIDPWTQTPVFATNWDCVWEVEKDGAGNVYILGGIMPMQVLKYTAAGALLWTYSTPYDTSNVWLGTFAVDNAGNSYITAGSVAQIQKLGPGGGPGTIWNNTSPGGIFSSAEFWTIAFNCDQTKLIIGGTGAASLFANLDARIYNVDVNSGNITAQQVVSIGPMFAIPPNLEEVRAITASPNGKYYFLTHDTIGYVNSNLNLCPANTSSFFKTPNSIGFGYKCEDFRYDNTGICAIKADANFVYTNTGAQLQKRSLVNGSIIASVAIPGGVLTNVFLSGNAVSNSGIDIDDCGNIYVGSTTGVYKFNSSLVQQGGLLATAFKVYDVIVSTGGNVIAVGGNGNSNSSSRTGGVQSFAAAGACLPIAITCCDATICQPQSVCATAPAFQLTTATAGGTWSGTGVNATGMFNPAVSGAGVFPITYTLACGSQTINVTVSTCAPISVCVNSNGTLTASNGTPTYSWQNQISTPTCVPGIGFCSGPLTVAGPPALSWSTFTTGTNIPAPGTYPIHVIDVAGGTSITYANVGAIPACIACPTLTLTISGQTNVTCNGGTNGAATVTATGGAAAYTYSWTPGPFSGSSQTTLSATTYTVNVLDANSCPGSTTVTITQPAAVAAPTASITTQPTCAIATGTLTVTAPAPGAGITYTVIGTAPVVAAQTNATGIFSGLAPGNYTVSTTVSGCTSTTTALTVNAVPAGPAAPTASVSTQPTCATPTGTITVTVPAPGAGVTYTLTGTAPVVAPVTNATGIFSGLAPGNYTVTTTVAGCTSTTTALTVNAAPAGPAAPTASVTTQPTCAVPVGEITVTLPAPGAGITYTLTGTAPVVAPVTNATGIFSGLAAGNYTVTTTVAGCTSTTTALTVNPSAGAPAAPTASITTQPTCVLATGTATVTVPAPAAGITYTIVGTAPVVAPVTNATGIFTGLTPGSYSVVVTIAGCNSGGTPLTVNAQPVAPAAPTATVSTQPTCAVSTGTITVTVPAPAAGTTYTLTGTAPVVAPQTNATGIFTGLASGDYTVTATVGGCTSPTTALTVNAAPATPAAPTASITTQPTCATPTGTATVTVPAPAAGTTYTITGTAPVVAPVTNTTGVFSGLTVGDYTITTTVGGCTSPTTALTVNAVIGAPVITVLTEIDVTCFGDTDGSASISAAGGTAPYTYVWSPTGGTGASATNLAAGNYTVTTTDFTGCATIQAITIGSPTQIVVGGVSVDVNCGTGTLGQITTTATGGNGVYTYSWTPNGETTSSLTNLSTGNYSVTVTDGALCSATEAYTISTSGSIAIVVTPSSSSIQQGESVQLNATGATSYIWSPATGLSCTNCPDPIATPSSTTTYIVNATDGSGCSGADTITIFVTQVCGDIFVPTVFSPNSAGPDANNTLCVYGGCIAELEYAIYNRWGEKVFETTDATICWDGNYKEKAMNPGVFAYKLVVTLFDGTLIEQSGNVTLIR